MSSEMINNEKSLQLNRFQRANPIFHLGENGGNGLNKMDTLMSPLLYLNVAYHTVTPFATTHVHMLKREAMGVC